MSDNWKTQVKGIKCSDGFEISIVRESNKLGQESWGWFDDNKLLICHNGGPCHDALTEKVWDKMIILANEVCEELNNEER